MASSKVFGGAEECHSSESGWTMYIGSRIDGENDHGINHENSDEDDGENDHNHDHKDDESDDSMVSDASSGPSHHHPCRQGERASSKGHGLAADKKAKKKPKEKQTTSGRKKGGKKEKALIHGKKP